MFQFVETCEVSFRLGMAATFGNEGHNFLSGEVNINTAYMERGFARGFWSDDEHLTVTALDTHFAFGGGFVEQGSQILPGFAVGVNGCQGAGFAYTTSA